MALVDRIKDILDEEGFEHRENAKSVFTQCPSCGSAKKFAILKANGSCVCYRGSCDFGRKWFDDFVMQVTGVTRQEAKRRILGEGVLRTEDPTMDRPTSAKEELSSVKWPPEGCFDLSFNECIRGREYMERRGVPLDVAKKYGVLYNVREDRVVFPIRDGSRVYGWQARAVGNVPDEQRMRNNVDFSRDSLLMFVGNVQRGAHVIVAEGPFDALKFDRVGGNVATMGKAVTEKQMDLIESLEPEKVYAALDDDAAHETDKLYRRFGWKLYLVKVPESCRQRCATMGKKPDFGECTFEEAEQAFRAARKPNPFMVFR